MKAVTGEGRKQLIEEIIRMHTDGELTLGMAIRRLRLEVTGFDQETFAQMCGMSTRALYQLETDKGNPTLSTVDSILRKFGLRMGLMAAIAPSKRSSLVAAMHSSGKPVPEYATGRGAKPKGIARHGPAADKLRKVTEKRSQEDGGPTR
ncbi:helix-turn-helix domain-containing protein [Pseudomonas sp. FME51]|uniref:helix-turn-helix domain-containing protein n=1 Tax=Pseudomonas sp. FME51 TaxID=2742609 RepID=UPI001D00A9EE|nr:helix-turn-helix transcriptional regulator [Pseudomonas sp. FME51]